MIDNWIIDNLNIWWSYNGSIRQQLPHKLNLHHTQNSNDKNLNNTVYKVPFKSIQKILSVLGLHYVSWCRILHSVHNLFMGHLNSATMISNVNSCQFLCWMTDLKQNGKVESNHFLSIRVDKSDEVCAIGISIEGSKIFKVEILLENHFMVVFIDVDIDRIFSLNIARDRVYSIFVDIGVAVESNWLRHRNGDSEILSSRSIQLKEIFMIADISVVVFIPLFIEGISLFFGLFAWRGEFFFYLFLLFLILSFLLLFPSLLFSHNLIVVLSSIPSQLSFKGFKILLCHLRKKFFYLLR